MTMSENSSQRLRHPVCIYSSLSFQQFPTISIISIHLVLCTSNRVIITGAFFQLQFFYCIQQIVVCQIRIFYLIITIVRHAQLTCHRCFSFYYNNTIRSLRTIDCHSCSVFQQGNTFNLSRIQVHDFSYTDINDTIQNEQRLVRSSINVTTHNYGFICRVITHT